MRVHFVAVAGTGMGALAGLFRDAGHEVTGSDVAFYPPMGPALRQWGVELFEGFDAKHLEPAPELVVVGNVCRRNNPEAVAAFERGLPTTSMAHALADHILTDTSPLVVGGTHGKTTTSAMAAWILSKCDLDPGFLIGGIPKNFGQSFSLGAAAKKRKKLPVADDRRPHGEATQRKPPFVVEGDEYDTAFFEKTPKFWHYQPEVAIVTSIEHDHIDIYPNIGKYHDAFAGFVERVPEHGLIIAAAHDPDVVRIVESNAKAEVAWFGLEGEDLHGKPPHWLAAPATADDSGQSFDLFVGGVAGGRAVMGAPGHHNIRNALAALAAACQGFGVRTDAAVTALSEFQGVKRRQDLIFEARGVRVYDDFAHHPTAVRETAMAMRAKHASGRLWAVFEPRSATACRALHQEQYKTSFDAADRVVFAPVGRPDIPVDERLDLDELVRVLGDKAWAAPSVEGIVERIAAQAERGDTILLLSNGAFGGIYEKLRASLSR